MTTIETSPTDEQPLVQPPPAPSTAASPPPAATKKMATMTASNPAAQIPAFLRERGRNASTENIPPRLSTPTLPRRRSSVLSYASDTRQSVQSSAGDIFFPSKGSSEEEDTDSHWHSSPLLFALLPGIGGVLFQNGAAFVTDVLLLGIAALYLNWSVRQPWEWYHSAQEVRKDTVPRSPRQSTEALASPNLSGVVESPRSMNDSVMSDGSRQSRTDDATETDIPSDQADAAKALRMHEGVALAMTFIMPALGAYLLHLIRGQLSKGSTALVSDYNLTIFLLAAEIRPCRQLMKLLSRKTLHLQRVATGLDLAGASTEQQAHFESRLEVLEAKISEPTITASTPLSANQREELGQLTTEIRKRYEPRIDALERAVRRYEKRVTTLTMLTDQRLQSLDQRLQDALSLAAVAAQSSQKPSILAATAAYLARLVVAPLEIAAAVVTWPLRRVEATLGAVLGKSAPAKKGKVVSERSAGKGSLRGKEKRLVRDDGAAGT